ncbi:MAG: serine/threonine-protein phosphatase [Oscillospiraceae bacterium]|nr:serine/threonine-protein phosphatase [Oscillospiraceae bacterium]
MVSVWGMTDIGLVRRENQDAYEVRAGETGHTICVVCDGMGGPRGGRLASELAVERFLSWCLEHLRAGMTAEEVREVAEAAVAKANSAVYRRAQENPGLLGMGTTLVSAIAWEEAGGEGTALVSNVGDSRAYLIPGGGGIRRVTRDHSLVERLVELGNITAEEARRHPDRNLITRALGPEQEALSDSYLVPLCPGDYILLCTDGLIETATDQEMEREILSPEPDHACLDRLLEIAKGRGAADNLTAVLLRQQ